MKVVLWSLVFAVLLGVSGAALAQSVTEGNERSESEHAPGEMLRRTLIELQQESGLTPDDLLQDWRLRRHQRGVQTPQAKSALPSTISNSFVYDWQFLGPRNQSGHINAVTLQPNGAIVVGASGGGIWRRNAHDTIWSTATDTFPSLRIVSSAVAPSQAGIMAMGTGEGFLYISTDSGRSWTVTSKAPGQNVMALAFDYTDPNRLWAATDQGLKLTTDLGKSWSTIANSNRARAVTLDPSDPNVIYYGRMAWEWPYSTTEIMKSTDGGKSFSAVFRGAHGYWSNVLFGMCRDYPSTLWIGLDSAHVYFRSTNGGSSWSQCAGVPWADSYTNGFWMFAADPHNTNVALAGGPGLFRTTDAGASWSRVDDAVHPDFHTVSFGLTTADQNVAAVGCDGGAYVTTNYLASKPVWRYVSNGLVTLEAYNVAGSPDGQDIVITGNQDNGYAKYTGDPANWKIVGGDGFVTLYSSDDPNTFFHEYTNMNLHRASDGFSWWSTKVMNGLPTSTDFYGGIVGAPVDWYGQAVAMDPQRSTTLYCGTDSLYRTTNNGDDWLKVGSDQLTDGSALTAIAVHPAFNSTIITGSASGNVCTTTDGGANWYHVPAAQFQNQHGRISSIVFDPRAPQIAYVAMQVSPASSGVFKTTNGGNTWKASGAGLPAVTPTRLLVDPEHPDTLFLGTTVGLFVSTDQGGHWQELPGFPNVFVQDLSWHYLDKGQATFTKTLLVGTYGRGIIRGTPSGRFQMVDTIVFPVTRVGRSIDTTLVLLTNPSSESVTVSPITTTSGAPFSVGAPFTQPTLLLPGSTKTVTVEFAPHSAGSYQALMQFTVNGGTPRMVRLIGVARDLTLRHPATIDFGVRGMPSYVDTVVALGLAGTVQATDTVQVMNSQIAGRDASEFNHTSIVGQITSSGSKLRVGFAPQSAGDKEAMLVIKSDADEQWDTIALRGNATNMTVRTGQDAPALTVRPNPAVDRVTLTGLPDEQSSLSLIDGAGRTVRSWISVSGSRTTDLEVGDVASGSYHLLIQGRAGTWSLPLVIEH